MFPKKNKRSNARTRDAKGVDSSGEALPTKQKTYSKFGSQAQIHEGIKFDSELELRYYKALLKCVRDGIIQEVKAHPEALVLLDTFWVPDTFKQQKNKSRKEIALWEGVKYNPDFKITLNDGTEHYIDTKSLATVTDAFVIKAKLVSHVHGKHLCLLYREMLDYLPQVFADLCLGRAVNPISKAQLNKLLKRYKTGEA